MSEIDPAENPKGFLKQIPDLAREIETLRKKRIRLHLLLSSDRELFPADYNGPSAKADAVKAVDERLDTMIRRCSALILQACEIVARIQDPKLRVLLVLRYLPDQTQTGVSDRISWARIAQVMGYDERHIYVLHKKALDAFGETATAI